MAEWLQFGSTAEWQEQRQRMIAEACEAEASTTVVAGALGAVYAHAVLGRPPPTGTAELRERGALALSALAEEVLAGRTDDGARLELGIARAGIAALRGEGLEAVPAFAEAFVPEAGRVVELLAGRLDGLTAARVAAALMTDTESLARARALAMALDVSFEELAAAPDVTEPHVADPQAAWATSSEHLVAAADDVPTLRDPESGVLVGRREEPALEAICFREASGERMLALYAADPKALRLEASGATTCDMQPGYWLGSLASGVERLDAKIYLGDDEFSWSLELSSASEQ